MSLSHSDLQGRLDSVELKLMDLEQTVQELNEVILQHYQDIERLRTENLALQKRLAEASTETKDPTASDEIPPHY